MSRATTAMNSPSGLASRAMTAISPKRRSPRNTGGGGGASDLLALPKVETRRAPLQMGTPHALSARASLPSRQQQMNNDHVVNQEWGNSEEYAGSMPELA